MSTEGKCAAAGSSVFGMGRGRGWEEGGLKSFKAAAQTGTETFLVVGTSP